MAAIAPFSAACVLLRCDIESKKREDAHAVVLPARKVLNFRGKVRDVDLIGLFSALVTGAKFVQLADRQYGVK